MNTPVTVLIHPSQFPEKIRQALHNSLRSRRVNHKFHYDSVKQVHKWLALHQTFAPSGNDPECLSIYDQCFATAHRLIEADSATVISLGCGGGQKDAQLIRELQKSGRRMEYLPVDVGTAMVLTARRTVLSVLPESQIRPPLVCDLATADDLTDTLQEMVAEDSTRLVAFFGMIPNFEPGTILPRLAGILRPGEWLLLSANLAPGPDYATAVRQILPQYDNTLTRDWLMTFLLDIGIDEQAGEIQFGIEPDPGNPTLQRIAADFRFEESIAIEIDRERFCFESGDRIRLFFSYRYTPEILQIELNRAGIAIKDRWFTSSGEEGIFLCQRR